MSEFAWPTYIFAGLLHKQTDEATEWDYTAESFQMELQSSAAQVLRDRKLYTFADWGEGNQHIYIHILKALQTVSTILSLMWEKKDAKSIDIWPQATPKPCPPNMGGGWSDTQWWSIISNPLGIWKQNELQMKEQTSSTSIQQTSSQSTGMCYIYSWVGSSYSKEYVARVAQRVNLTLVPCAFSAMYKNVPILVFLLLCV